MARPVKFDDEEVLGRAMALVRRRGVAATSIRDLEAVLDLRAPAIYRRFGSRDGLLRAVLDHYVDVVVRRRIDRYLPGVGDPLGNLEAFFVSAVTPPPRGGRLFGCLLTETLDPAVDATGVTDARDAGLAEVAHAMRSELVRVEDAGRLAAGIGVDEALGALTLAWHGLMALARAGCDADELTRRARSAIRLVATR